MAPFTEPTSTALRLPPAIGTSASALYFDDDRSRAGLAKRAARARQEARRSALAAEARVADVAWQRDVRTASTLAKRANGSSIANWSEQDRRQLLGVSDSDGNFNGTCSDNQRTLPPNAEPGACTSYYPDVTIYCCAGVGGMLGEVDDEEAATSTLSESSTSTMTARSASSSASSAGAMNVEEPTCRTSDYKTMLLCYKYTAETHCRSAVSGPYGICHPNSTQWNASAQHDGDEGITTISGAHASDPMSSLALALCVALGASMLLAASATSLA